MRKMTYTYLVDFGRQVCIINNPFVSTLTAMECVHTIAEARRLRDEYGGVIYRHSWARGWTRIE